MTARSGFTARSVPRSNAAARIRYLVELESHLLDDMNIGLQVTLNYTPQVVADCFQSLDRTIIINGATFQVSLLVNEAVAKNTHAEDTCVVVFPVAYYAPPGTPRPAHFQLARVPRPLTSHKLCRVIAWCLTRPTALDSIFQRLYRALAIVRFDQAANATQQAGQSERIANPAASCRPVPDSTC